MSGGLILAGCGRTETAAPAGDARPPVSVAVAPIQGVDEPVIVEATGSFQPDESSDVAPEASGPCHRDAGRRRTARAAGRGPDSHPGGRRQPPARRRAAVARADANLKLAESQNALAQTTAKRNDALLTGGLIPQTVADEARTQAKRRPTACWSRARRSPRRGRSSALAEKAVSDVVVVAPFAGYVSQRRVAVGEFVQPSTAVRDAVTHRSAAAAADHSRCAGRPDQHRTDGASPASTPFPDKVFEGKISALKPAIAAESRSFAGRGARAESRRARSSPACSPSPRSIRDAPSARCWCRSAPSSRT